ncbi:MAG: monomethylamine:corrinoid methyltransferase, partial [Anaerolineales bacterium]|nr:monomethylamine:corrinoid methyltransferase [Anaerolineales bacterium]
MKEADFDMAIARRVPELIQVYGLTYDPEVLVPSDDDMASRLYQAGMDLFLEMGAYNMSTQRRVLFTRDEVEETVALAPKDFTVGTGKDAKVMRKRGVESEIPCLIHSGPTGTPCSEQFHPFILESCAQEPLVDCLGGGSVSTYMGEMIIPGTPLEILGVQRDAAVAREATRKAGRPGMHINDVASPLTCAGKIATINPDWGMRPTDGLLVSQMVELKTDYDQLSRASRMKTVGMHIVDLMTPLVGGLGGGPQGTAIVTIACHLLGVMCYDASYHVYGHMHLLNSTDTDRMGLWVYSVGGQALVLNSSIQSINAIYTQAGLGTEEVLWEIAAASVACTVSGIHQGGVGATGGSKEDHTSGLENRFNAQVSHSSLGMTRDEANGYVLEFLRHYEETHKDPPPGKPFSQIYKLDPLEPTEEWLDLYNKVSDGIVELGLDIRNGWKKAKR